MVWFWFIFIFLFIQNWEQRVMRLGSSRFSVYSFQLAIVEILHIGNLHYLLTFCILQFTKHQIHLYAESRAKLAFFSNKTGKCFSLQGYHNTPLPHTCLERSTGLTSQILYQIKKSSQLLSQSKIKGSTSWVSCLELSFCQLCNTRVDNLGICSCSIISFFHGAADIAHIAILIHIKVQIYLYVF